MALCAACKALTGSTADKEPHPALLLDTKLERSDGSLCTYRCSMCRSLWLRFTTNETYGGPPQVWERI